MMAGNPNCNWWSMHPPSSTMIPSHPQYLVGSSNIPFNPLLTRDHHHHHHHHHQTPEPPPHSWSQLLFTGLPGEEERLGFTHFQPKKLENLDHHHHHHLLDLSNCATSSSSLTNTTSIDAIKHQDSPLATTGLGGNLYGHGRQEFQPEAAVVGGGGGGAVSCNNNWPHMVALVPSSPSSCVTTNFTSISNTNNNNNILDFSYTKHSHHTKFINQPPDQSSQCNSTSSNSNSVGGSCKKARVQASSTQPHLKVRKEKLGDRITALHQLVSPFGKTDIASVLLEAIGYIRFLQAQIQALSSPYLTNASKNNIIRNHQQSSSAQVNGERNSVFPEDPGQLLNDNGLKRKGAPMKQDVEEEDSKVKDLKSRGLCLVPVSCTQHVGNENGADYWAPAFGTGF